MDNDSIDRLDIRVIKSMLADLTVDIESIKETIESLEQNNEDVDTKLTDISSSLEILLQNAEID
jgi:chaperonin cofactor prefoldin